MKKIMILITLTIMLIANAQALEIISDEQKEIILNKVLEQIEEGVAPTFTNIESTVYYSPLFRADTDQNWCSPENQGQCLTSTEEIKNFYGHSPRIRECIDVRNAGWCCINENHRGAYENVRCQGSMVVERNNERRVYHHSSVADTLDQSTPISQDFVRGRTSQSTDAKRMWTVAVNSIPRTPGYIPYGTIMYIYWGEGNPWNGLYRAEDTGSAFLEERKIDIYAGVGEEEKDEAINAGLSNAYPRIYLLDANNKVIDPRSAAGSGLFISQGEILYPYAQTVQIQTIPQIFESVKNFLKDVETCGINCLEDKTQEHTTNNLVFSTDCPGPKPYDTSIPQIIYVQFEGSTPIYYKFDGEWLWSPDQDHWMDTEKLEVSGGRFEGSSLVSEQTNLIAQLNQVKNDVNAGNELIHNVKQQRIIIPDTEDVIEIQFEGSTPIYYKFDGEWLWSPDEVYWMNTNTLQVRGGDFQNLNVNIRHRNIISTLNLIKNDVFLGLELLIDTNQNYQKTLSFQQEKEANTILNKMADCLTDTQETCLCDTQIPRTSSVFFKNSTLLYNFIPFESSLNINYPRETRGKFYGNFSFIKEEDELTHIVLEDFSLNLPGLDLPSPLNPDFLEDEEEQIPVCVPQKTHKTICVHNQITTPLTFVVALDN